MTVIPNHIPKGWALAGSNPADYEVHIDTSDKKPTATLKANKEKPAGFATLMQEFSAEKFRSQRMQFSAYIKTKDVVGWSGLWMKVEGAGHDSLGFDNMKNRALSGNNEWKEYSIVLDVPEESKLIAFGVLLSGAGEVWIKDVTFEKVAKTVKTTNLELPFPPSPVNLNFAEN